jgi:hypothetical protein
MLEYFQDSTPAFIAIECKYSDPKKTDNKKVTVEDIENKIKKFETDIEPHLKGLFTAILIQCLQVGNFMGNLSLVNSP